MPQVMEHLGSAAFSRAVQARDLRTGSLVCLKVVKVRPLVGLQSQSCGTRPDTQGQSLHSSNTQPTA